MSPYAATAEHSVTYLWDDYLDAGRPKGGPEEDALARHYLPYATQVGERFHRRVGDAVDRDDIVQNGLIGLIEAIRTFDPAKATFQTYANRKIQWKIADGLRGGDWLPRRRRDNLKLVQRTTDALAHQYKQTPTDEQIVQATGLTLAEVRIAYEDFFASRVHSLNDLLGGESTTGTEAGERFRDRVTGGADDDAIRTALHSHMYKAIKVLPAREKQIIALYYYGGHTLEEIGQVYGIGYSRISQILKRAVFMLRVSIEGSEDDTPVEAKTSTGPSSRRETITRTRLASTPRRTTPPSRSPRQAPRGPTPGPI